MCWNNCVLFMSVESYTDIKSATKNTSAVPFKLNHLKQECLLACYTLNSWFGRHFTEVYHDLIV